MNKKVVLGLLAVSFSLIVAGVAVAEGKPGKKPGKRHFEKLKAEVGLTDEQAKKLREVRSNARENCADADSRRERRKCMGEQRESVDQELATFLSEEQISKLKEFKKERRDKMREKREAKFKERLNLTDEQAAKMKAMKSEAREKCNVHEDRKERRECMKAERKGSDEKLATILNEEQMEQFKELRKELKDKGKKRFAKRHKRHADRFSDEDID